MDISNAKVRVLEYCKLQHISKQQLGEIIGVTPGALSGDNLKNHLSTDKIQRFLKHFDKVSPDWLLFNVGPMYRANDASLVNGNVTNHAENNSSASITLNMEKQCAELIRQKDETIAVLRELIESLKAQIGMLEQACSENHRQSSHTTDIQATKHSEKVTL